MHSISTSVTYKVPDWNYCNIKGTKDKCRFCIKSGKGHVCVLHNMPLASEGTLVIKERDCIRASAGYKSVVEDTEVNIDPKTVMKMTMQEYRKIYNKLLAQGYPDVMADKLAQQSLLGGK